MRIKHFILSKPDQYKQLFFAAAFLLLPALLFSQNKIIDSLLLLLKNARQDTVKINLNYQLAEQLSGYDVARAEKYLAEGYELAKTGKDAYNIANYYLHRGEILFDLAKYPGANSYFDSAIILFDRLINSGEKDPAKIMAYQFGKTDCLTGKGLLASKLYHYQESIQYYLEAIAGIESIEGKGKNDYMATLYADIASDYYELEQFETALEYDRKALPYLNADDNADLYVVGHLFVADDYSGLSMFDSSSVYLEKARPVVLRLNKPNLDLRFYYITGGICRKKNEWKDALINFQKANDAALKINDEFQVVNSKEGMAASYMHLGDLISARETGIVCYKRVAPDKCSPVKSSGFAIAYRN